MLECWHLAADDMAVLVKECLVPLAEMHASLGLAQSLQPEGGSAAAESKADPQQPGQKPGQKLLTLAAISAEIKCIQCHYCSVMPASAAQIPLSHPCPSDGVIIMLSSRMILRTVPLVLLCQPWTVLHWPASCCMYGSLVDC